MKVSTLWDYTKAGLKRVQSFLTSPYFMVPMFGLDFALKGGTQGLVPLLQQFGLALQYPLLYELGFALLIGYLSYKVYQATMHYVVNPALKVVTDWCNTNIYQPIKNYFFPTPKVAPHVAQADRLTTEAELALQASGAAHIPGFETSHTSGVEDGSAPVVPDEQHKPDALRI